MALRELLLKLGVQVDKQGEKKALATTDKIKTAAKVAAVAFAAIGAVKVFVSIAEEVRGLGDEIDKTSKQLGINTQALQEMRFAADLAGVSGKVMSDSLAKIQRNAFEAARGNKLLAEDFARLGVSVKDANGNLKSAEVLTQEAADGFARLSNDSEKVAISMNLFGRSGKLLIPLLNQGSAAIAEQRAEARSLGGVLSQDLINASAELTDDQARLKFAMLGLKTSVAEKVIPVLIDFAQWLTSIAKRARGPVRRAMTFLERVFFGLRTGVGFASDKLDELGQKLADAGDNATLLGKLFKAVGNNMLSTAAIVFAAWLVATSPLLLMVVLVGVIGFAILAVIADLQRMGDEGEGFFATLVKGFEDLLARVDGDWGEAMKEVAFNVFNFWFKTSRETFDKMLDDAVSMFDDMIKPVKTFINLVTNLFLTFGAFVADVWTGSIETAFFNLWENIKNTARAFTEDLKVILRKGVVDFVGSVPHPGRLLLSEEQQAASAKFLRSSIRGFLGVGQALQTSGAATVTPRASGGTTIISQPNTSIAVSVTATGRESPDELGKSIGEAIGTLQERKDRAVIQNLVIAKGGV